MGVRGVALRAAGAAVLAAIAAAPAQGLATGGRPTAPSGAAKPIVAHSVIAVMGDVGLDLVNHEYTTANGADVVLPPGVTAVRVAMPAGGDREARIAALRKGLLGHPSHNTLYYLSGTRILLYTGDYSPDPLANDFHGTGTTSLAVGRSVGTAPDALLVVPIGSTSNGWEFVSKQRWIDVASESAFAILGQPVATCDSARAVNDFRATGHLTFTAAGNGPVDTMLTPPGGLASVVRVGGVNPDGSPFVPAPNNSALYSAREYDVSEQFVNRIANISTASGYSDASGTSGSAPRIAGRVAQLLATVRAAVGDPGVGVRDGALVVAKKRPTTGPLADGRLTADELLAVVLNSAKPSSAIEVGRYLNEGYGLFNAAAAKTAVAVILGTAGPTVRSIDDTTYTAAMLGRTSYSLARGCTL